MTSVPFVRAVRITAKKSRRDDPIDRVRGKYWFWLVCTALNEWRPLHVQRILEPNLGAKDPGMRTPNKKYLEYSRGIHVPGAKVLRLAEMYAPGSSAAANHLIWIALRVDVPISISRAKYWLRSLSEEVQQRVFDEEGRIRIENSRRFLEPLERRASLDALAALVVILRLSHKAGMHHHVEEQARSLLRILLMLGLHFGIHGVVHDDLFAIFVDRIFPLALEGKRTRFYFEEDRYLLLSTRLEHLAYKHCADIFVRQKNLNSMKVQILRGKCEPSFVPLCQPGAYDGLDILYRRWIVQ